MTGRSLIVGMVLGALCGPALADDCAAVNASFKAVQDLSVWDQKITLMADGKATGSMEMFTMDDFVYLKTGTAWRKMSMPAASRKATSEEMMKTMGPSECSVAGTENINGAPTTIYAFKQPDSLTGSGDLIDVRMWIGDVDHLPRKSVSPLAETVFTYDSMAAPIK